MRIALYLDEDSQDSDLVQALRLREVDVLTATEAGMNGREDEEQLDHAAAQERVLYSFNARLLPLAYAVYCSRKVARRHHPCPAATILHRRADAKIAQADLCQTG